MPKRLRTSEPFYPSAGGPPQIHMHPVHSDSQNMATLQEAPMEMVPGQEEEPETDRPPPIPVQKIHEIVFAALADAQGASDTEAAFRRRVEKVAMANPGFAEAYPKLLEVVCSATTAARAQSIRTYLPLMLAQMRNIDQSQTTFEDASKVVGIALGAEYAPKKV